MTMTRIYHTWDKWECYPAGFYDNKAKDRTLTDEQVLALGEIFGKDLSKKSVMTPGQALKLNIDESVIMAYSYIPKGEPKLAENNPNDASKIFNNKE